MSLITLQGVDYGVGGPLLLESVDLAIEPNERVCIVGRNGAGKSTLLRLLAGLYDPTAGRILMDNVDLNQIHPRDLRRHVGYLGQEVRLIEGSLHPLQP